MRTTPSTTAHAIQQPQSAFWTIAAAILMGFTVLAWVSLTHPVFMHDTTHEARHAMGIACH